jgi:hypothetical protein
MGRFSIERVGMERRGKGEGRERERERESFEKKALMTRGHTRRHLSTCMHRYAET